VADLDGDGANEFIVETVEGCGAESSFVLQVFRSESFFEQPVLTPLWRGVQSSWTPSFMRFQLDPGAKPELAAGQAKNGNLQLFRTLLVDCPSPPTPVFEYSPAVPVKGQRISFTDRSAGGPANWYWDFGDGTTAFGKDPLHAYSKAGTYDVTMTVANAGGAASSSTRIIVSADPSFLAGFSLVPPNPVEGQAVKFADQTTGLPATWSWDFGDNTTGSGRNPVHVYDRAGTYSASLTISDGPLTSTLSRPVAVLPRSAQLLLLGGRIGVAVTWRSQYSGETGIAAPLPQSDQFGYFAFSSPTNPEVFVKALDFGIQSPYLVFFSGLTDYEYTVTFTSLETGQSLTFLKPAGSYSGGADNSTLKRTTSGTSAFDNVFKVAEGLDLFPVLAGDAAEALRSPPGLEADTALYLSGGNVRVQVNWRSQYSGATGQASTIPKADEFGYFYFTEANNPEVFVKVLDFGASSPYLLFFGGLTDFEYTVTFTNVKTGKAVSFKKDAGAYAGGADNKGLLH
jgi:PKD repeat protein